MDHLDPERLTRYALEGGPIADADREHLDRCPACRLEYAELMDVVDLGRETRDLRDLPAPPASVWAGIAAATGTATPPPAPATIVRPASRRPGPATPPSTRPVPAAPPGPSTRPAPATPAAPSNRPGPAARPPHRGPEAGRPITSRRWWRPVVVTAAAAVLAVAAMIGVTTWRDRVQPAVTATAALAAYGTTPASAHGDARIIVLSGQSQLRLAVAGLPASGGYYEVWLIDPDTNQMISIGILGGQSSADFPLPSTVDISAYRLVDVSAEPYDGNPAHSGHSLLRGTLHA